MLKELTDPYPTRLASSANAMFPPISMSFATAIRQAVTYSIGADPTSQLKRWKKVERDIPAAAAKP